MDNYKDKEKITIWTYTSPSKEYGLIMGLIFGDLYAKKLTQLYPKYVNMDGAHMKKLVYEFYGNTYDIRKYCWQKAFIPYFMIEEFLNQYFYKQELKIIPSPDKDVYYVERLTCELENQVI